MPVCLFSNKLNPHSILGVERAEGTATVLVTKDENKAPEGPGTRPASTRGGAPSPQTLRSTFKNIGRGDEVAGSHHLRGSRRPDFNSPLRKSGHLLSLKKKMHVRAQTRGE